MVAGDLLHIYMNGIRVGELTKTKHGAVFFNYVESWLNTPGARPISLSLPLVAKQFSGELVYNFFSNLLPDNIDILKRIQARFKIPSSHPFDLLAVIGKDCVGAIQITDAIVDKMPRDINYKILTEKDIADILRSYRPCPLGMSSKFEDFRISVAGAQEKAGFLYHNNKWAIPVGATPTTHIFKLPIGFIEHQQIDLSDSCENEWLCLKIAAAFGIKVAECNIKKFSDVKVLLVTRFDRRLSSDATWIMRLPQEDMCQALGVSSNLKYQSDGGPGIKEIMRLLLGSEKSITDQTDFFKAQILFWLLCALDGHAKNFSLFINPGGRYTLAPLYDIISAFPLVANKQISERKINMAMALKGKNNHYKWFEGKRSHFISMARSCDYPTKMAESLLDEMLDQVEQVINGVSAIVPKKFPTAIAEPIFEGMKAARDKFTI